MTEMTNEAHIFVCFMLDRTSCACACLLSSSKAEKMIGALVETFIGRIFSETQDAIKPRMVSDKM
jgi:hypothetical protein